jgi:predicted RNA-binding protein associated with RNAse of E/G family
LLNDSILTHQGYYIDVGASNLIATGAIKLQKIENIIEVLPDGIKFDSVTLPADEIVFATGYGNMVTTARKILGEKVLQRVEDVWGFNENDEMKGIWRQARKGLWFMGGSLALARWYSRGVALGVGAVEQGLME